MATYLGNKASQADGTYGKSEALPLVTWHTAPCSPPRSNTHWLREHHLEPGAPSTLHGARPRSGSVRDSKSSPGGVQPEKSWGPRLTTFPAKCSLQPVDFVSTLSCLQGHRQKITGEDTLVPVLLSEILKCPDVKFPLEFAQKNVSLFCQLGLL